MKNLEENHVGKVLKKNYEGKVLKTIMWEKY
jgi:hypothetical protein